MSAELGQVALLLAFLLALVQGTFPLLGAWKGNARWMALGRSTAVGQFIMVLLAFLVLTHAFVVQDVVLPGQRGLGRSRGVAVAVAADPRRLDARRRRLLQPPAGTLRRPGARGDGLDHGRLHQLHDLHQQPLRALSAGSVAFAFAIAALLDGKVEEAWIRWSRPWTLVAWAFLTAGIALGSWWAYYELGWGGWWFWDPVENASFMPWLVGTALIHSQAVTEKRGTFRNWTLLLAISAFSLSLLGTFLVRSGVLTSVHAFANDPERGMYILAFLAIVVGGALTIFALRAHKIGLAPPAEMWSRETLLLANNVLLTTSCAMVLLGTLWPLAAESLGMGKVSVGPPYFGLMFTLIIAPLVALIPFGPLVRWAGDAPSTTFALLKTSLIAAVGAAGS